MKMKNFELRTVIGLLSTLELSGKKSRDRSKFIKLLEERAVEVDKERIEMLKDFANKDENDEPVIVDGKFDLTDEALDEFNKQLEELLNEECVIDTTEKKPLVKSVKEIVLNCEIKFSGQDAVLYDRICDIIEGE